jgi:Superinfection immunity protein
MDNVTLIRIISGVLATSVFLLPLYVLPTILAWKKTHRMPILLLNLLLGWTLLGWIGAAFCSKCGKNTPALAQFCSSCGHPLVQNAMSATSANRA